MSKKQSWKDKFKDVIKGEVLMDYIDKEEVKEKYGDVEGGMETFLRGTRVSKVEVDLNSLESKVPRSEYVKEGRLITWGWYGDWFPTVTRLIEDPNQDHRNEDVYDDVVLNDWLDEICSIRREIINGRRLRNVYLDRGGELYTSIEDTPNYSEVNLDEYEGEEGLREPDYFDHFINRWRTNSEDKEVLVKFLERVITYVKCGREKFDEVGDPLYSTDVIFEEKNYLDHLPEKKGKLRQMLGSLLSKMVIRGSLYYKSLGIGGDLPYLINKYLTSNRIPTRTGRVVVDEELGIFRDEDHKMEYLMKEQEKE